VTVELTVTALALTVIVEAACVCVTVTYFVSRGQFFPQTDFVTVQVSVTVFVGLQYPPPPPPLKRAESVGAAAAAVSGDTASGTTVAGSKLSSVTWPSEGASVASVPFANGGPCAETSGCIERATRARSAVLIPIANPTIHYRRRARMTGKHLYGPP